MKTPLLIIGGGLSGLAAGIRCSRYSSGVLLVEKHDKTGGLNSYYTRKNLLIETGLHAITNFALPGEKHAPFNKLLRQLKISRKVFSTYQQLGSEILFNPSKRLSFTNDISVFTQSILRKFPDQHDGFMKLLNAVSTHDPFQINSFISAREFLKRYLTDQCLIDMILCPLMFYGSSVEDDMDLDQFVIMFRSIFIEGMFRPAGTIKDLLDMLEKHYTALGGNIHLKSTVKRINHKNNTVSSVTLQTGETITCDNVISTIGYEETLQLLGIVSKKSAGKRLGFVENIYYIDKSDTTWNPPNTTILFYNDGEKFSYKKPDSIVDFSSGVICFPYNFTGRKEVDYIEVRSTHLSNYGKWFELKKDKKRYKEMKEQISRQSYNVLKQKVGAPSSKIFFQDTFTPLTIERYSGKKDGAIYGSPVKYKSGNLGYSNLFLAGTDQGFLGIVGSMLSGVSIVNKHILPQL